jgi:membrane protein YdbS with pleckstrin-like domain
MRVHAAILALVLLIAAGVAETVLRNEIGISRGTVTLPTLLPLIWLVFIAPGRRYRAWGYAIDPDELQVRHGIWTQVHTVVPLDRVQHIDVSQGPLERGFGVCRLVLHTAGTAHSQVIVPGLARPTAEAMRDEIRARIRQEEK